MKGIELAFLAIGAVVGAFLRYRLTEAPMVLGGFSVNLLLVNVVGSFILGIFTVVSPFLNLDSHYTMFISIGFCGSLTSMSAFALETSNFLDNNYLHFAVLNIIANALLSVGGLVSGKEITNIIVQMML
jgi:fluoride exporter